MRVNWSKNRKVVALDYGWRSVRCWLDDSEESLEIEVALRAMKAPIIIMSRTESHGIRNPFLPVVVCVGHRAFGLANAIKLISEVGVGQVEDTAVQSCWTQLSLMVDTS